MSIDISNPATRAEVVTPSDGSDLPEGTTQSVYVGTSGDLAVNLVGSEADARIFKNVNAGQVLPIQATRIRATSTTADNILALYNR